MARRGWIGLGVGVVLVVALAGALLWVKYANGICTSIGCDNTVWVDLRSVTPETLRAGSVELCVNGTCATSRHDDQWFARAILEERTVRSASVKILGPGGERLTEYALADEVEAEEWLPNGSRCEPTCWRLILVAEGGRLEPQSVEQSRSRSPGTR